MARLNESTASAEPIEILKRRFVRQNREIARVNSIQSLRIRSLEAEVSHLLSENVSLREKVINLTQALERLEASKALHDGVYDVKARLDSKLMELSNLVAELGSLPRRYSKASRENPDPALQRRSRQSSSSIQNEAADLESSLGPEAERRLPVIMEDKFYPRRTLEAQGLEQLLNNDPVIQSSAELEDTTTPPKRNTEYDEPPSTTSADAPDAEILANYKENEHSLPPNLETKRKKKTEPAMVMEKQAALAPITLLDSKFAQKCGAKRKFCVEDEESFFESVAAEDDGFEFSRPVHSPLKSSSQNDHSLIKRGSPSKVGTIAGHGQSKRTALEPKSTNTNILSPTKPRTTKSHDRIQRAATPGDDENSYRIQGKGGLTNGKAASPRKPSTSRYGQGRAANENKVLLKGTIPNAPLLQEVDQEVTATAGMPNARPSRRQRSVVSYAEPNLRDKMRRSTNELGPAVGGDKPRKSSSQTDPIRELNEHRSESTSAKKARNSDATNGGYDLFGIETLASHTKRQMNMISQRKCKTSGRYIDDIGCTEHAIVNQSQDADNRDEQSQEDPNDQISAGISQSGDTIRDRTRATNSNASTISTDVDQAVSDTNRKSRRHSSNMKVSGRSIAPRISSTTLNLETECIDSAAVYSASSIDEISMPSTEGDGYSGGNSQPYIDASFLLGPTEMTRGQRVAARRRSMML